MASNNRAAQINKVIKVVRKRFQPAEANIDRSLIEHLLFACCLENSLHEDAERVFATLSKSFYDWNEVRVTSIRELATIMKPLNDPPQAATRLKRVLHSVFETHYSFDLEGMKKQNIGQAVKQLDKYNGSTSFTVAYVTQNALGGHSIPINKGLLEAMRVVGVISDAEASKGRVPGLERSVPKSKGVELGTLLHQLGVELHRSPYGPTTRKLLLEIDPKCKDRLPKRPSKKALEEAKAAAEAEAKAAEAAAKEAARAEAQAKRTAAAQKKKVASTPVSKKDPVAKPAPRKTVATTKAAKKKTTSKKTTTRKKSVPKKTAKTKKAAKKKTLRTSVKKKKKKSTTKRLTKRKPR